MPIGIVCDPVVTVELVKDPAGPPAGRIAQKTVGFRRDVYWLSWEMVVDEWSRLVEEDGARVLTWRHSPPIGKEAESLLAELDQFVEDSDVAVIGLASCGACTMWTIHDAMRSLRRNRPTAIVATEHFGNLARELASSEGRPDIRLLLLPHPFEGRSEDEVRRLAREAYPRLLETLGAVT
ncbi:MAG TPA: hypothetical protein VGG38_16505 [Acidimicrobiales bacterium]|jgi:hypothetical protein